MAMLNNQMIYIYNVGSTIRFAMFVSQANSKEVFLEIDVENEMLKSATAPLTQLAGRRLSDLTFSPFALQICKRLCRDAAAIESSNQVWMENDSPG